ncbi:MAG TPA: DUF1127 domain-containing protein [Roseovarius sp.]
MSIYITRQMIDPAHDGRGSHESDGLFRRLFTSAVRNWQRRKAIAELEAMDDATLRDIGIYRNDIPRVVNGFNDRDLGIVPVAPAARSNGGGRKSLPKGGSRVVPV